MSHRDKILLVEDHDDTRRAMSLLLRREGFEVIEASNAVEGIAKLDGQAFALLDVNLPDKSGVEIFQHIRELKHPTIVAFITATGHPELLDQLTTLSVDAIFKKPIDFDRLLQGCVTVYAAIPSEGRPNQ